LFVLFLDLHEILRITILDLPFVFYFLSILFREQIIDDGKRIIKYMEELSLMIEIVEVIAFENALVAKNERIYHYIYDIVLLE
jgi:hypothetical protein